MVNFGPLVAEIGSVVWSTPANFNGFRILPSLLQQCRSPKAYQTARCLAVSWVGTVYIHFRGLLPSDRILPGAKFTLRPSLAFSYIGSVTARHSSSRRQPNFVAWYREWNYRTVAEGATCIRLGSHHVGHQWFKLSFFNIHPIFHDSSYFWWYRCSYLVAFLASIVLILWWYWDHNLSMRLV